VSAATLHMSHPWSSMSIGGESRAWEPQNPLKNKEKFVFFSRIFDFLDFNVSILIF
jgi:hypothetical protein